jgi:hypothetical protein
VQNARPEHQRSAEAQARLDYRWLLDDQRGRRLARLLLVWSAIEDPYQVGGASDVTAFVDGKRSVGWMLRHEMRRHYPEGWLLLETEHLHEQQEVRRQLEQQAERSETDNGGDTPKVI